MMPPNDTLRSTARRSQPARIEYLRVENYRALKRIELKKITTQTSRAADIQGIPEFMAAGASLGHLWLEGRFGMGDPLVNQGAPTRRPA